MEDRLTTSSAGVFDSSEWISEGDGMLLSARTMRVTWLRKKRNFNRLVRTNPMSRQIGREWAAITGFPRAAMLLLGYSVEMFLKAGVAKAYHGCRSGMFERDIRRRFGHDFKRMAKEVAFPASTKDFKLLQRLSHMVVDGARYPVTPSISRNYYDTVNQRTTDIWSSASFSAYVRLAKAIRDHIAKIDQNSSNPAHWSHLPLAGGGYVQLRYGGGLPPRITVRWGENPIPANVDPLEYIKSVIADRSLSTSIALNYWKELLILEDSNDKTVVLQKP